MAHHNQLKFIEIFSSEAKKNWKKTKILEIGSYDVDGNIRKFFERSDYLGVDLIDGPCVDIVGSGHNINYNDNYFDLTISTECFEHNPYWEKTLINMIRMTKKGGVIVFTCASKGRVEHGTERTNPNCSPGSQKLGWNYYKNLEESDFNRIIFKDLSRHRFYKNSQSFDLYFIGEKKGQKPLFKLNYKRLNKKITRIKEKRPFMFYLWRVPIYLASKSLSEENFQSFAISWKNFGNKIRALLNKRK